MTDITKRREQLGEQFYKKSGYVPTEFAVLNFQAGFDAGVSEMQAELNRHKELLRQQCNHSQDLQEQLKAKDAVIDVAVKALEKIQDDHFVAEYSSELRNLKKISRTTLEQIQKMRGGQDENI